MKIKILLFDIESQPILGYTWGMYEQNVLKVVEPWKMLCFAYKWLGEKKTHVVSLPMVKGEKELIKELHKLFVEADIIVGHNGDNFDIKKSNAKFIEYNLTPPDPYKTIDTLKIARRFFKFDSNKLDSLGEQLGVGRKLKTGGFDLWTGCMSGDEKSWRLMQKYNKMDVILLEKVYLKLRPWIQNHVNLNVYTGEKTNCPSCGSKNIQRRGFSYNATGKQQRWQCMECFSWHQSSFKPNSIIK
jgi:DNA polymerase elongation subunit (family B)